jgi:hypothetical protein
VFGRAGSFVDEDVEAWHLDCWAWLIRCAGGIDNLEKAPLILPTREFFPATEQAGHAKAEFIFELVKKHCGMQEWPVKLVAQRETAERVATFGTVQNFGPAGTFQTDGKRATITYDPRHTKEPINLIATFSHELGHYLNGGFPEAPPGGWGLVEPATDVTAAFLGFGLFCANSAFHFTNTQDFESQGWSTSKFGYITEAEWVLSLAIFCAFTREDTKMASQYLKPHLAKQFSKAVKYVEKAGVKDMIVGLI